MNGMQPNLEDPRVRKEVKRQVKMQLDAVEWTLGLREALLDAKKNKLDADTREALAQIALQEMDIDGLRAAQSTFQDQLEQLGSVLLVPRPGGVG